MKPYDKMMRAKVQLGREKPFYGYILLYINIEEDEDIPSVGIDVHGKLKYNPEWVNDLTEQQMKGVFEHEALHLIFQHLKRRETYTDKDRQIIFELWAVCEDMVVNDILISEGQNLPEGIKPQRHRYTMNINGQVYTVKNIDEKRVEYIFDEVMSNIDLPKKPQNGQKGQDGQQGDGQGQGNGQQEDEGQGNGQGQDGKGQEQEQETDIPQGFDKHERPSKEEEEEKEKKDDDEATDWRKVFVQAKENAKMKGNLPAGIERRCEELFQERINWKSILYRHISQTIPFDYTWQRPSRRSESIGVYLPRTKKESIDIIVSIDTSASISDNELTEFLSEMKGIADSFQLVNMTVVVCDMEIHHTLELKNANPRDIQNLTTKGGGGTSHEPVFRWIEENKPNARLLIAFTDGMSDFPEKPRQLKTIWALSGNHIQPDRIPFGKTIVIPEYEFKSNKKQKRR